MRHGLWWRWRRYGRSRLRLKSVPLAPGQDWEGALELHMPEAPRAPFEVTVSCLYNNPRDSDSCVQTLWTDKVVISESQVRAAAAWSPCGRR